MTKENEKVAMPEPYHETFTTMNSHQDHPCISSHPQKYSENAVVFDGGCYSWKAYLELPPAQRYEQETLVQVRLVSEGGAFEFIESNKHSNSEKLVSLLNEGFGLFIEKLTQYPCAASIIARDVFFNSSNTVVPVQITCSKHLPTEATREIFLKDDLSINAVYIVLNKDLIESVASACKNVSKSEKEKRLGILLGLIKPLLHELGHSNLPKDRFFEEIHQVWCDCIALRNVLFRGKRVNGYLVPKPSGSAFITFFTKRLRQKGIAVSKDDIFQQPFFKMLNQLHRVVGEDMLRKYDKIKLLRFEDLADTAKVIIRGYLDDDYLRPSLAQVMPEIPKAYRSMEVRWKKGKPVTPPPKRGRYGILDEEDLSAWNKVAKKFRKIGLVIVCQLGIGEFGRVYEAINLTNPNWPKRVAVKVDRIYKERKDEVIQTQDVMLHLSQDLSYSPHVISIYDAGLLSKKRTYHVLQLVAEGETLDVLLGIGGEEGTSRPFQFNENTTLQQLKQNFLKPIGHRSNSKRRRFSRPLTLNETIDIMVSMLLWVERVHDLGYAINDVKTGNLMINGRGQLKGIDLDFYRRVTFSPQTLMQDFFLLSWTCILLLINAPRKEPVPSTALKNDFVGPLQKGPGFLRDALLEKWAFSDLPKENAKTILDCFIDIIFRARTNTYGVNPKLFKQDIHRLNYLKRLFLEQEIILTTPTPF